MAVSVTADASGPTRFGSARVPLVRRYLVIFGTYAFSFAVLLLVWQAIPTYLVNPAFFATPEATLDAGVRLWESGRLQENIVTTLLRVYVGFTIGCFTGIWLGLILGNVQWVRVAVEPYLQFGRFVPSIALIPLTILWFGIGETQKTVLIVWTSNFIVMIGTMAGVVSVPQIAVRAAQSLGATHFRVFMSVTVPFVVPYAAAGIYVAMVNAFGTVIVAEMAGAESGLGYMILVSTFSLRADIMFVGIVSLAVLGFLSDRLFRFGALAITGKYGTKL